MQPETVADTDAWICPLCNCSRTCTRETQIVKAGDVLILHLKRHRIQDGNIIRITDSVSCLSDGSASLRVPVSVEEGISFSRQFRLVATINHSGSIQAGGHYWAYINCPKARRWLMCNDAAVTKANVSDISNATSCLFFYVYTE